ncbi:MAG: hypothetical protein AB8B56_01160 [Crocinitomicaceae bacterium]
MDFLIIRLSDCPRAERSPMPDLVIVGLLDLLDWFSSFRQAQCNATGSLLGIGWIMSYFRCSALIERMDVRVSDFSEKPLEELAAGSTTCYHELVEWVGNAQRNRMMNVLAKQATSKKLGAKKAILPIPIGTS